MKLKRNYIAFLQQTGPSKPQNLKKKRKPVKWDMNMPISE